MIRTFDRNKTINETNQNPIKSLRVDGYAFHIAIFSRFSRLKCCKIPYRNRPYVHWEVSGFKVNFLSCWKNANRTQPLASKVFQPRLGSLKAKCITRCYCRSRSTAVKDLTGLKGLGGVGGGGLCYAPAPRPSTAADHSSTSRVMNREGKTRANIHRPNEDAITDHSTRSDPSRLCQTIQLRNRSRHIHFR